MTMIATTYPLSHYESRPLATTGSDARAWGFWATLVWFGGAVATYGVVSILCGLGYAVWSVASHPSAAIDWDSPTAQYLAMALSMPAAALLLMFAARRAGTSAFGYLGLTRPAWRHFAVGLGLLAIVWCLAEGFFLLFPAFDQTPEMIQEYRAIMGNPAALALYWVTLTVTAPVFEEIIFRGFLMRGWSETRLGFVGAILLSSLVFAAVHLQYNMPTMAMVLGLGLVFGLMRWRSGSTTVSIMLHATWNVSAGILFAWQAMHA